MTKTVKSFVISLLSVLCLARHSSSVSITSADIENVRTKLKHVMGMDDIPDEVNKWLTVLDKNLNLLNCLPINREGNCYKSNACLLPDLTFDGKQFNAQLAICRDPWKITIDFDLPKLPWWVDVRFSGIVIPINNNVADGVTTIASVTEASAKVLGIINVYKAELRIDATLRWDCTKPHNDAFNRAFYNIQAPEQNFDSLWYTFKVRIEVKKKHFPCFCYKCERCEDIVNKSGTLGDRQASCSIDATWYAQEKERRRLKCLEYLRCTVGSKGNFGICAGIKPDFYPCRW